MSARVAAASAKAVMMPILKNKDINPAANSKFWLPLKGAVYFFKNPKLWQIVLMPLCCAVLIDLIGFIVIFAAALVPQALAFQQIPALADDLKPLTFLIATVLCFFECLVLVLITANVVLGHWGGKLFRKTLELEGCPRGREMPCKEEVSFSFWMGSLRLFLEIVLLPLHLIPCIGSVAYAYLNGLLAGWDYHQDFLVENLNLNWHEQYDFVMARKSDYTYFGFGCMLLSLVPLANFVFCFTNNVGAAIWAANLYKTMAIEQEAKAGAQAATDGQAATV